MTKYAYCKVCDKEVNNPVREPMETFQKVVWVILSIATVGVVAIIFVLVYANRKKDHCPTCRSILQFSDKPHAKEEEELEALTPRERVLKKAGKAKEKKIKTEKDASIKITKDTEKAQNFCPYCGEDIDDGISRCPYCHSSLKAR